MGLSEDEVRELEKKGYYEQKPEADLGRSEHVVFHGIERVVDMNQSVMNNNEMNDQSVVAESLWHEGIIDQLLESSQDFWEVVGNVTKKVLCRLRF